MRAIIKYRKWWHKFVPAKRRQLKVMQAVMDHITSKPEFQKKVDERVRNQLLYGMDTAPDFELPRYSDIYRKDR